jgi:hypothetical protein
MKQTDQLSEFEQFAKDKGHKVGSGHVIFEQDEAAAMAFETEAHKAGFDVIRSFAQSAWGDPPVSEAPKDWFVRLASKSQ